MEEKTICMNCGRVFPVWDTREKKIKCPFCDAKGDNPYYIKPKHIKPESMFQKLSAK